MTVETQINRVQYLGDGAATVFPVPFPVRSPEHLHLYVWDRRQAELTEGFTVIGAGVGSENVSVVLDKPLTQGVKLTILRIIPYIQPMDLVNGGDFNADTLEGSDDNLEMQIQQIAEIVGRAFLAPESMDGAEYSYEDLLDLLDRALEAAERAEAVADHGSIASGVYNIRKPWIAKDAVPSGGLLTLPGWYYPTRDVLVLWYQGAICSPRALLVEAAGAYQYDEIGEDRNVLSNQVRVYFDVEVGDLLDMYVVSSAAGRNLDALEAAVAQAGEAAQSAEDSAARAGQDANRAEDAAGRADQSADEAAEAAEAALLAVQAVRDRGDGIPATIALTGAALGQGTFDGLGHLDLAVSLVSPRITRTTLSAALPAGTAFTVPSYLVGVGKLQVFIDGLLCRAGSDGAAQYEEVGPVGAESAAIIFHDDLPAGSELTVIANA